MHVGKKKTLAEKGKTMFNVATQQMQGRWIVEGREELGQEAIVEKGQVWRAVLDREEGRAPRKEEGQTRKQYTSSQRTNKKWQRMPRRTRQLASGLVDQVAEWPRKSRCERIPVIRRQLAWANQRGESWKREQRKQTQNTQLSNRKVLSMFSPPASIHKSFYWTASQELCVMLNSALPSWNREVITPIIWRSFIRLWRSCSPGPWS